MSINDYALVKSVEAVPILYENCRARGPKNSLLKDEAWRKVSRDVGASERACITRWKSLRDRFAKEFRRSQENQDELVNWDMFEHLIFLKDHHKHGQAYLSDRKGKESKAKSKSSKQENDNRFIEEKVDPEDYLFDQKLIGMVRDYPVIYDTRKVQDSPSPMDENRAWQTIAESLGVSENHCSKRWKELCDRYAREYRYNQLNPEKAVTWTYFNDLYFLESLYENRSNVEKQESTRLKSLADSEDKLNYDYPFECIEELDVEGVEAQSLDGIITKIMPEEGIEEMIVSCDEVVDEIESAESTKVEDNESFRFEVSPDANERLTHAMTSIEKALLETKDCLAILKRQRRETAFLDKIQILLSRLDEEKRKQVERKILRFLSNVQSESQNGEEFVDIDGVNY